MAFVTSHADVERLTRFSNLSAKMDKSNAAQVSIATVLLLPSLFHYFYSLFSILLTSPFTALRRYRKSRPIWTQATRQKPGFYWPSLLQTYKDITQNESPNYFSPI